MTINQRKKGHDFERKIAKKLQEDLKSYQTSKKNTEPIPREKSP